MLTDLDTTAETSESSEASQGSFIYQITLNGSNDTFTGTVSGDSEVLQLLSELSETEKQQLEAIQTSCEVQKLTYTTITYVFVLVLAFGVFSIVSKAVNGIFGG